MKQNSRIIMNIVWLIVGGILISLSFAGKVDEFWNSMGFSLIAVGVIQLVRSYRLYNNRRQNGGCAVAINCDDGIARGE